MVERKIPSVARVAEWDEAADNIQTSLLIPKWILAEKNFSRILAGDWNGIRPITAEFVTTLNCNFRCAQCSYMQPKQALNLWVDENSKRAQFDLANNAHMDMDTMRASIDNMSSGGVKNILFTGGGEPFMNAPVTLAGMNYAKEKGMTIGLYTNGALLNEKIIDDIFQISPLFVRVSVYGSTPESFSKYTGRSSHVHEKVIQNIKALAKRKSITGSKTQLGLSYLLHPYTTEDIDQFSKTVLSGISQGEFNGIDFCRFTPAVNYFGNEQHSEELMTNTFDVIGEKVKPKLEAAGIDALLYFHRLNDLHKKKNYSSCRASGWYLEVGPSGDSYICCEKLFMPENKIGNLVQQSLEDMYASDLRKSVIERINASKCQNCPTLCKPHELNKIFHSVDLLLREGKGSQIREWRSDLIRLGENNGFSAGKLNDFES